MPSAGEESRGLARKRTGVLVGLACLYLYGAAALPLQEPDEGRYGDVAASMARTGDWLTPRLNGIRYYEKPPLYFWLGAACVAVLGPIEAASRLPSALACLGTILVLMKWGRRVAGARVGLLAGAIAGTLPLFALLAHMAMVDLVLTFLVTGALYSAWRGVVEPEWGPDRPWILAFWGACALAVLTKGPVGIALPLGAVIGWLLLTRSWSRGLALARPDGPLLFLAVAAPWFVAMERVNPGHAREFFLDQNYARAFSGAAFNRDGPSWYYVPRLALYSLPWAPFILGALRGWRQAPPGADSRLRLFLLCSIGVPFAILSFAQSKLGYYLLPLVPPMALLAAVHMADSEVSAPPRFASGVMASVGALCLVGAALVAYAVHEPPAELNARWGRKGVGPERTAKATEYIAQVQRQAPLIAMTLILAAAGLLGAAMIRSRDRILDSTLLACTSLAILECGVLAVAAPLPSYSTARDVARLLERSASPGEPILLLEEYMTSLPYYLGRPVTIAEATFPMFGHAVREDEAEGLALPRRPGAIPEFLRKSASTIVVFRTLEGVERAQRESPGRWTPLGAVGRYSIWRCRP